MDSADDVLSPGFQDSFVDPIAKTHPPKHPPTTNPFASDDDPFLVRTHRFTMGSSHPPTNPFAQSVDPFADFDSVAPNVDENDPFTNVITRAPEHPAPIHQTPFIPPEQAPPHHQPSACQPPVAPRPLSPSKHQAPLIDLGEPETEPQHPQRNSLHAVASDDPLFSSGSQSSQDSGKRFSSSASSSSDSGAKTLNHSPKKEQNGRPKKGLL